jgi:hypothetical protein
MPLVNLLAGAMVTTGAALVLVGIIGLALTRSEEKEERHEREDQSTGA